MGKMASLVSETQGTTYTIRPKGYSTGNFKCQQCEYKSKTKQALRVHTRIHTKVKPYSCLHCDLKSSQKASITKHVRRWHSGAAKPVSNVVKHTYQCAKCSYKAPSKYTLKKHSKIHTNVKRFGCPKCAYRSRWKYSMVRHERTGNHRFVLVAIP